MEQPTSRQDFLESNDFCKDAGLVDGSARSIASLAPQQRFDPFWLLQWGSWGLDTIQMQWPIFTYFSSMNEFPTGPRHRPHLSKSLLLQVSLFIPLSDKNCVWVSSQGCSAHCGFIPLAHCSLLHQPQTQRLPCALLSSDLLEKNRKIV